jgi:YfiH family protein
MPRPEKVKLLGALRPEWPVPPGVHALFTTRAGGVSRAPFDTLNLGDHVGDDPQAVAANRAALAISLGVRPVFLRQVHGTGVVRLTANTPDGTQADACLSTEPGLACTVMVADCLPVLFTDSQGHQVAAAHAGWRGLAGLAGRGVLETTFDAMLAQAQQQNPQRSRKAVAADTLVWLGPCIGPTVFEVGPEVRAAFLVTDAAAAACFTALPAGKWLADLAALARSRLQALGIERVYGNNSSSSWCTVGQASDFFSHRRDAARLGSSGRMAACIWLA